MPICTLQITLPPCEDYVAARCCLPMRPACQAEPVTAAYAQLRPREWYRCRVYRQFSICDFSRFRYFYIYHRGVDCFKNLWGCTLVIKFGIAVKYVDCHGKKRGRFFEDSVQIAGLKGDFELSGARARFTDLICRADDPGRITAGFSVAVQAD